MRTNAPDSRDCPNHRKKFGQNELLSQPTSGPLSTVFQMQRFLFGLIRTILWFSPIPLLGQSLQGLPSAFGKQVHNFASLKQAHDDKDVFPCASHSKKKVHRAFSLVVPVLCSDHVGLG